MISVLAIGMKVLGFKPGPGDRILRVIKICRRLPLEGK
jgi:enoyl reductase-like protein